MLEVFTGSWVTVHFLTAVIAKIFYNKFPPKSKYIKVLKKESVLFTLEQKSTNRSKLIYIWIEHTTEMDNNEITKY